MEAKPNLPFSNVDEYIALQPNEAKVILEQLRQAIKTATPEAEEIISYRMPAYKFHGMLAWFAACKNHCGLYLRPKTLAAFKAKLGAYQLKKSAVHFPLDQPVPAGLVTEMVWHQAKENLEKLQFKLKG